jgi:hypothetical protein
MHLYWEWAQPSGASSPQWEGNTSTICHMTDAQKYEVYLDIAAVYPQPTQPGTIGQTTEHKAFCVYIGEGHI